MPKYEYALLIFSVATISGFTWYVADSFIFALSFILASILITVCGFGFTFWLQSNWTYEIQPTGIFASRGGMNRFVEYKEIKRLSKRHYGIKVFCADGTWLDMRLGNSRDLFFHEIENQMKSRTNPVTE